MSKFRFSVCLAVLVHITTISAQKNANSPYTRYGMGELVDQNVAAVRSMAGISTAFVDPYHSSFVNPASLAFLTGTSYEVGLYAKNSSISDGTNKSSSFVGSLDYLSIAFPLHNSINDAYENVKRKYRLAMGFKLAKFSNVGYDITTVESHPEFGGYTRSYDGNGGSYSIQWSNAVLHKNFALGVNLGYLFGKTSYNRFITFDSLDYAFDNVYFNSNHISGFIYNVGMLYSIPLSNKEANAPKKAERRLTFGLRGKSATPFSTTNDRLGLATQNIGATTISIDTIFNDTLSGKGQLPLDLGFGITFTNGDKSSYGIDVSFANWSSYYNDGNGDLPATLRDAMTFSFGGSFRPDYKAFNFWKRATYRYGVYYRQDPRLVKGDEANEVNVGVNEYAITAGVGLPFVFQRKVSHVNIGLEVGNRGVGTIIKENFFKINIGATFNDDEWFIKRKYD